MYKIYIDDVLVKETRSKNIMYQIVGKWYVSSFATDVYTKIVVKKGKNIIANCWTF